MDINHSTILHYKHFCVTELWTELTALDVLHFILFTKTTVEMRSGWGSKSGNTMNWFKQKKKKINKKKIQRTLEKDVPSISLHKQKKNPTLYAHGTQVSTWNPQSPWSFTMVHKHFHCYFWACFLATLHWCNSCRNWWELRTDIWKVKVFDRKLCNKNTKESKLTQCRKDMQQIVFFQRVFPSQFKCLLTVCS